MYPTLPHLLQGARNRIGQVQKIASDMQLLMEIRSHAAKFKNGVVDWHQVYKNILKTDPDSPDNIPTLISFVQKYGGGVEGQFIQELDVFTKKHMKMSHRLPIATFKATVDWKCSEQDATPLLANAVIKCQTTSPEKTHVVNNVCQLLKSSEIRDMMNDRNRGLSLKAEQIMRQCRALLLCSAVSRLSRDGIKVIGTTDVLVVRFLCNKQQGTSFVSLESIGSNFVKMLNEVSTKQVADPWKDAGNVGSSAAVSAARLEPATSTPSTQVPIRNIAEYDSTGKIIQNVGEQLRQLGVVAGRLFAKRDVQLPANAWIQITSGSKDSVHADMYEQGHKVQDGLEISIRDFDQYKPIEANRTVHHLLTSTVNDASPSRSDKSLVEARRATVFLAMRMVASSTEAAELDVRLKPSRAIYSKKAYGIKKMVIPLYTNMSNISVQRSPYVPPHGSISIPTRTADMGEFCTWVSPSFCYDAADSKRNFMSLGWAVGHTPDMEHANCVITLDTVIVTVGGEAEHVNVPIVHNFRPIKKGDELLIYKEPAASKAPQSSKTKFADLVGPTGIAEPKRAKTKSGV